MGRRSHHRPPATRHRPPATSQRGGRVEFGDSYQAFLQQYDLIKEGTNTGATDALRDKTTGRRVRLRHANTCVHLPSRLQGT